MFNETQLDALRVALAEKIPEKRYIHTLEVEKMAFRLGRLFFYEERSLLILRAAALLHDITKAYSNEAQKELATKLNIAIDDIDRYIPKSYHAKTAAALIPVEYPDFALPEVISAVRWHTTGKAGMNLYEKIVYFADYIDMSRKFDDCVMLRDTFWNAKPEEMTRDELTEHFDRLLLLSYDITIKSLLDEEIPICRDTVEARNSIICEKYK